jgi:hypothetical protein
MMIVETELREALMCINHLTCQLHPGDTIVVTIKNTRTGELEPLVLENHHRFIKADLNQRSDISVEIEEKKKDE